MADISQIMQQNTDQFTDITPEMVTKLSTTLKGLGFSFIVDEEKNPEYVSKTKLDEANTQKNTYKQQTGELTKQLEALKQSAGASEEFKKQISQLQGKLADSESKNKEVRITNAIKFAALKAGANNEEDILAIINRSAIKENEDGTFSGLEEQMKSLQETKSYLFNVEVDENNEPSSSGGKGNQQRKKQEPIKEDQGVSEFMKAIQESQVKRI